MPRRPQHLDDILRSWPHVPGEVNARIVKGSDGREVIQLRIEMGVMQLEVKNRPDGTRPGGAETYFDYLLALAIHEGDDFVLDEEQCAEADREFVQFYQRRICWLALRRYRQAVRDADHSLALMDFVRRCSPSQEWTQSHEQYRPYILFHRTQAAALAELEEKGPESAIEQINEGLERIRQCSHNGENGSPPPESELCDRLVELREQLREHFRVGLTLRERLAEAVAREQYELAAQLRDEIARRHR